MQSPIPSLVKVYSLLLQEEGQRNLQSSIVASSQEVMAMCTQSSQPPDSTQEAIACVGKNEIV